MPFTNDDIKDLRDFFKLFRVRRVYDVVFQNFFFIGVGSFILVFQLFQSTLIEIELVLLLIAAPSMIVTALFVQFYRKNFTVIWALVHNTSVGLFVISLLLFINYRFSSIESTDVVGIEQAVMRNAPKSKLIPVAIITVHGHPHEVEFPKIWSEQVMSADSILVNS